MIILDASVVVAALIDGGPRGRWAREQQRDHELGAPAGMPAEVMGVLRRAEIAGRISSDVAAQSAADLLDLSVGYFAFAPFGPRVWDLRASVTTLDAWYVALAESLRVPLATLDLRLTRAHGPQCAFSTPPVSPAEQS